MYALGATMYHLLVGTGKAEAVQFTQTPWHITSDRPQVFFTHHKVHRQIALTSFTQSPVGKQLQAGQLTNC